MICKGARFHFTLETIGGHIQLEMSWIKPETVMPARFTRRATTVTASEEKRSMTRDDVQVVSTGEASCPLRVTQMARDAKEIQICLPLTPHNEMGEGSVNMPIAGHNRPNSQHSIACVGNSNFGKFVTHSALNSQAQFADASAAPDSGALSSDLISR